MIQVDRPFELLFLDLIHLPSIERTMTKDDRLTVGVLLRQKILFENDIETIKVVKLLNRGIDCNLEDEERGKRPYQSGSGVVGLLRLFMILFR